jgi:hypothetical protein
MKSGNAGIYFTFLPTLIANTVEFIADNALKARHLKLDESPDDILPLIAQESGIVQYYSESNSSFRDRIADKWSTVPYYGRENTLTGSIYTIGNNQFVSVSLNFNLEGTDIAISPTTPSGSTIQPYPPSTQNFYQFAVEIEVNSITATATDVESNIIPDKQLNSVRRIVKLMKPVDFACREIRITYVSGAASTARRYDHGSTWDDPSITWYADGDWSTSYFRTERHAYK